jgi:hypothetical protein
MIQNPASVAVLEIEGLRVGDDEIRTRADVEDATLKIPLEECRRPYRVRFPRFVCQSPPRFASGVRLRLMAEEAPNDRHHILSVGAKGYVG